MMELLAELIALRQRGVASAAQQDMGWLKNAVRSLCRFAGRLARQPDGDGLQMQLLNVACQDTSRAGFVYLSGLLALPASAYRELPTGDPLNDALRRCGQIIVADSVVEAVRGDLIFIDFNVLSCFANFGQVATGQHSEPCAVNFNGFDYARYWGSVLGTQQHDNLVPDWSGAGAVGRAHFVWALDELVKRYEQQTYALHLGAAMALLGSSRQFREWLRQRLADKAVMSPDAWNAPWPRFVAPAVAFLEAAPPFASLFALAARAAAAGLLDIDETLTWLEGRVVHRWMAEEGIAVLVGLAPELLGHQLIFWELMIRTVPHT